MKDKNSLIGWLLIGLVFVGFMVYNNYTAKDRIEQQKLEQAQAEVAQQKSDSIAEVVAMEEAKKVEEERTDSTNALFTARQGQPGETVIENNLLRLTITNKGAQLMRAELKDETYKNQQGGRVVLFDGDDSNLRLIFEGKEDNVLTDEYFFTPKEVTEKSVVLSLPVADGSIDVSYALEDDSYVLDMDVQAQGLQGFFPAKTNSMGIVWTENMRQQEKGYSFENRYSTITYRDTNGSTDELSASGSDEEEDASDFDSKLQWVAFKTQFFSQILIADGNFSVDRMESKQIPEVKEEGATKYLKTYTAELNSTFDPAGKNPTNLKLYIGPNRFSTLKENEALIVKGQESSVKGQELDLQSIVYLGWPVIRWINRFVFLYLFDWMTGWGLNMGLVLLIITLIVKFAVFPLMRKSYLSSANMRVLRPKIDEINAKYPNKEDAMLKQQEVMQLYSQYGVSPMGGCLPMVIQMPIWIALFNFIPNAIELRGQSFLWADDLSTYDDVINWGFNIWGIGDHLSLFCVLWCLSTVANTWISMRQQQAMAVSPEQEQSMKMMRWMSYIMPLVFFFSFNSYSSGLNYYYFVSGLITILMMWYLRKTTDDSKLLERLEARYKERKANPKKTSSMMERMQAMAAQQQEMLKKQQEAQQHKK
ncbi:MAG: membrane protein insertase YidC [Bacteroidaceae bacterium]|nr:membrane protein insertase YidC [Bacteroidaceae bacterium]